MFSRLAVAHNYKLQGKNVLLLKPELDVRFGIDEIASKAGLREKVIKPILSTYFGDEGC